MTITAAECLEKFGPPELEQSMQLWKVPENLAIGAVPRRIYCNRYLVGPLTNAFYNVIARGLEDELKTWDGCFNIRDTRGKPGNKSLHAWGMAIDINATGNGLGQIPTMNKKLVACFTDAGFEWGGTWKRLDGMHFQLRKFP